MKTNCKTNCPMNAYKNSWTSCSPYVWVRNVRLGYLGRNRIDIYIQRMTMTTIDVSYNFWNSDMFQLHCGDFGINYYLQVFGNRLIKNLKSSFNIYLKIINNSMMLIIYLCLSGNSQLMLVITLSSWCIRCIRIGRFVFSSFKCDYGSEVKRDALFMCFHSIIVSCCIFGDMCESGHSRLTRANRTVLFCHFISHFFLSMFLTYTSEYRRYYL